MSHAFFLADIPLLTSHHLFSIYSDKQEHGGPWSATEWWSGKSGFGMAVRSISMSPIRVNRPGECGSLESVACL